MEKPELQWVSKPTPDDATIRSLAKSLNINTTLATLLSQRGIASFDQARTFFRPLLLSLHDPFLMQDMDKAVNRLTEAVAASEKVLVYGDYDVDGTTSVSLVYLFLKNFIPNVDYYIPDRYSEGYGISEQGMRHAHEQGFTLVIALDCGIKGHRNLAIAQELGVDVIVCDHHNPGETLPPAFAVLDPKRTDCQYPYKELSGCGVGFKLLQGFCQQQDIPISQLYAYLDLVAVSIASDIVPITDENRILAYYGLKKINQQPLPGIKALMEIAGLKNQVKISDLVFYLGPRINAAGRLTHARESVRLLICDTEEDLTAFAATLHKANQDRRDVDQSITQEALAMIESDFAESKSTVLFNENWHKGVIGIVASRCIEHYYRPTIILTQSNGKATGSARSIESFDLYEAIHACAELLDQFGGHTHAAGLTLSVENIPAFRERFEREVNQRLTETDFTPKLPIDLEIGFDFINERNYSIISQMEPFGPHNMQPIFVTENVVVKYTPNVLKEQHLKMVVAQEGFPQTFDAIGFGLGHLAPNLEVGKPFRMAYQIDENHYQGNKTLQLVIKDIKMYR